MSKDYENIDATMPPAPADNYQYDGSGNFVRDYEDGTRIRWNAYGKVVQVRRVMPQSPQGVPGPPDHREEIYFRYDATGNRVAKYVLRFIEPPPGAPAGVIGDGHATYYVRDANAQVIAVYERTIHPHENEEDPCWPDWAWPGDQNDMDMDQVFGSTPPMPMAPDCDNCDNFPNPWQEDYDGDGKGDACDNCPLDPDPNCLAVGGLPESQEPPPLFEVWEAATFDTEVMLAELHIYGNSAQGRVGMYVPDVPRDVSVVSTDKYQRVLRKKQYEIKDHLGNVRVVVSDLKLNTSTGTAPGGWIAEVLAWNNYYPFGMVQPGRHGNTESYRYGFNGKEMDNEVREDPVTGESGVGSSCDYGSRVYNPVIGKLLSMDPIASEFPWSSPYRYAENNVISDMDLDGLEYFYSADGQFLRRSGK